MHSRKALGIVVPVCAATVLAVGLLTVSPSHAQGPPPVSFDHSGKVTEQDVGREIFKTHCGSCHGYLGQGTKGYEIPATGPALKGDAFVIAAPETAIALVIRNGRTGAERHFNDTFPDMPGFDATLIPDIRPLLAYLKGDMQK